MERRFNRRWGKACKGPGWRREPWGGESTHFPGACMVSGTQSLNSISALKSSGFDEPNIMGFLCASDLGKQK